MEHKILYLKDHFNCFCSCKESQQGPIQHCCFRLKKIKICNFLAHLRFNLTGIHLGSIRGPTLEIQSRPNLPFLLLSLSFSSLHGHHDLWSLQHFYLCFSSSPCLCDSFVSRYPFPVSSSSNQRWCFHFLLFCFFLPFCLIPQWPNCFSYTYFSLSCEFLFAGDVLCVPLCLFPCFIWHLDKMSLRPSKCFIYPYYTSPFLISSSYSSWSRLSSIMLIFYCGLLFSFINLPMHACNSLTLETSQTVRSKFTHARQRRRATATKTATETRNLT